MSSTNIYTPILCSCVVCRKEYSTKGIHTHFERTHGSDGIKSKYPTGNHGKYDDPSFLEKIKSPRIISKIICTHCDKEFEHEYIITHTLPLCCSKSCSASRGNKLKTESGYTVSEETKNKISKSVNEYNKLHGKIKIELKCQCCDTLFLAKSETKRFCSKECFNKSRQRIRYPNSTNEYNLHDYRCACGFKFSLNSFPDEFDFNLIKEFGWYKAKNRGDNQQGISRDHKISIRYGFDNHIDPKIISHPANCQLLRHNDNVSKGKKNSISLEELLVLIEKWNKRYGVPGNPTPMSTVQV